MNKFHTTDKGTKLPITNLKGKDYMMVAYRIQWFREMNPNGRILTEALKLENDYAIFRATIMIPGSDNQYTTLSTATKKEDVKGFADFTEKAETGAIGRALALAGYGTQFSVPELDEEARLADAPLELANTKLDTPKPPLEAPKTSSFRKPRAKAVPTNGSTAAAPGAPAEPSGEWE